MAADEEEPPCRPVKKKRRKKFCYDPVKLSFMHALYIIDTRCICHVKADRVLFCLSFYYYFLAYFLGHHWRLIFQAMPNHSLMFISLRYDTTYRQKSEAMIERSAYRFATWMVNFPSRDLALIRPIFISIVNPPIVYTSLAGHVVGLYGVYL